MGDEIKFWVVEPADICWSVRNAAGEAWSVEAEPEVWETVRSVVGTVLGVEVAEHHLLAAHGEGIFHGLDWDVQAWAARTALLLENGGALRQIIAEWPDGHQMMSRTELKQRAWNAPLIDATLSAAAVLPNPHYSSGGDMVLFDTRKVLAAERTNVWRESTAKLRAQRAFRRLDRDASPQTRAWGRQVAAMDPGSRCGELAGIMLTAPSPAVRDVAAAVVGDWFAGREWTDADLADPAVAEVAVALGPVGVVESALRHPDTHVRSLAAHRVTTLLAGPDRSA